MPYLMQTRCFSLLVLLFFALTCLGFALGIDQCELVWFVRPVLILVHRSLFTAVTNGSLCSPLEALAGVWVLYGKRR